MINKYLSTLKKGLLVTFLFLYMGQNTLFGIDNNNSSDISDMSEIISNSLDGSDNEEANEQQLNIALGVNTLANLDSTDADADNGQCSQKCTDCCKKNQKAIKDLESRLQEKIKYIEAQRYNYLLDSSDKQIILDNNLLITTSIDYAETQELLEVFADAYDISVFDTIYVKAHPDLLVENIINKLNNYNPVNF